MNAPERRITQPTNSDQPPSKEEIEAMMAQGLEKMKNDLLASINPGRHDVFIASSSQLPPLNIQKRPSGNQHSGRKKKTKGQ